MTLIQGFVAAVCTVEGAIAICSLGCVGYAFIHAFAGVVGHLATLPVEERKMRAEEIEARRLEIRSGLRH